MILPPSDIAFVPLLAWPGCRFLFGETGADDFLIACCTREKEISTQKSDRERETGTYVGTICVRCLALVGDEPGGFLRCDEPVAAHFREQPLQILFVPSITTPKSANTDDAN